MKLVAVSVESLRWLLIRAVVRRVPKYDLIFQGKNNSTL